MLLVLCACTILLPVGLEEYYYQISPRIPQPQIGKIFPEDIKSFHGVARVYLSQNEALPFRYLPALAPVFAFAALLLNKRWALFSGTIEKAEVSPPSIDAGRKRNSYHGENLPVHDEREAAKLSRSGSARVNARAKTG